MIRERARRRRRSVGAALGAAAPPLAALGRRELSPPPLVPVPGPGWVVRDGGFSDRGAVRPRYACGRGMDLRGV
nr:MAG TPA: hypothetical protein [Caudoviricetes sp.]